MGGTGVPGVSFSAVPPASVFLAEVEEFFAGHGDGEALSSELRQAALCVPLLGRGALWSGEWDGVRWLYAFTSMRAMYGFLRAKWELDPRGFPPELTRSASFVRARGAWLLDEAVPAAVRSVQVPVGLAVDVGGERPLLLPPLSGIVPDEVAVDRVLERVRAGLGRSAGEV